jgi:hypothetical protein
MGLFLFSPSPAALREDRGHMILFKIDAALEVVRNSFGF